MKNKQLRVVDDAAHPWPLRLARELFHAGALEECARFVSAENGRGYIMFQTRWGDTGMLVRDRHEARMMTILTAKTVIARNLPGIQLMS